jgi:hypothetical protein
MTDEQFDVLARAIEGGMVDEEVRDYCGSPYDSDAEARGLSERLGELIGASVEFYRNDDVLLENRDRKTADLLGRLRLDVLGSL